MIDRTLEDDSAEAYLLLICEFGPYPPPPPNLRLGVEDREVFDGKINRGVFPGEAMRDTIQLAAHRTWPGP